MAASRTAEYMALYRALENVAPRPRFRDPFAASFLFAMLDAAHRAASPMRPERCLSSLPVGMVVVSDGTVLLADGGPFAGRARRLAEAGWAVRELAGLVFEERHARPAEARLLALSDRPATPFRQEPGTQ